MQNLFSNIWKTVYGFSSHLGRRVRLALVFFFCFITLALIVYFRNYVTDKQEMMVGTISVFAISVLIMGQEPKKLEADRWLEIPLLLFALGIVIISRFHYIGNCYSYYAMDLLIFFPLLYYVCNSKGDYSELYTIVAAVLALLAVIGFAYCLELAFKGKYIVHLGRAYGFSDNPNLLGMIGITGFISAAYLALRFRKNRVILLVSAATAGLGLVLMFQSAARTSILSALFAACALLIMVIRSGRVSKDSLAGSWKWLLAAVLVFALAFYLGMKIDNIQTRAIERQMNITTETTTEDTAGIDTIKQRTTNTGSDPSGNSGTSPDPTDYSSGRIDIWKVYLSNLSPFGGDIRELKEAYPEYGKLRAHNNFLDYMFRCGIIVGSFYVLFYIALGIKCLRYIFSKRYSDPEHCFLVMVIITYMIYAMLEVSTLPFTRVVPAMFFLTVAPVFIKESAE